MLTADRQIHAWAAKNGAPRSEAQEKLAEAHKRHGGLAMIRLLKAGERIRIPEHPEAVASLGFTWAEVVSRCRDQLMKLVPEARNRQTFMRVIPRANDIRFEFYDDPWMIVWLSKTKRELLGAAFLPYDVVVSRLGGDIVECAPEVQNRKSYWMRDVRINGLRLHLFLEEAQLLRAEAKQTRARPRLVEFPA